MELPKMSVRYAQLAHTSLCMAKPHAMTVLLVNITPTRVLMTTNGLLAHCALLVRPVSRHPLPATTAVSARTRFLQTFFIPVPSTTAVCVQLASTIPIQCKRRVKIAIRANFRPLWALLRRKLAIYAHSVRTCATEGLLSAPAALTVNILTYWVLFIPGIALRVHPANTMNLRECRPASTVAWESILILQIPSARALASSALLANIIN